MAWRRAKTKVEEAADAAAVAVSSSPAFLVVAVTLIAIVILSYWGAFFPHAFVYANEAHELYASDPERSIHRRPFLVTFSAFIISAYLNYCTIFHFWAASTTEPGGVEHLSLEEGGQIIYGQPLIPRSCKKCHMPKPHRAHHCSVCNRCVLKYDHHCPWLHQCVGHHNQRYFILFLFYMVICSIWIAYFGWSLFKRCMFILDGWWPYVAPQTMVILSYVLVCLMGLGLLGMLCWNISLVSANHTTIENYDTSQLEASAKRNNKRFIDAFHYGWKRNWMLFFNSGKRLSYPIYRPLIPIKWDVHGDGVRWDTVPLPTDPTGYVISFGGVDIANNGPREDEYDSD